MTLKSVAQALKLRGYEITVVAPEGSVLEGVSIVPISGRLQITAQTQGRDAQVTLPQNSVLANMWDYARRVQNEYELLFNFAYDWLPFYLTPFFERPIAHLVSMGSLTDAMDDIIEKVALEFSGTIGVHSFAQAETFRFKKHCRNLQNGFDLSLYQFCSQPQNQLAWVGRIAPEKGLEDAVAAAEIVGIPLKIWGVIQDEVYWQKILTDYPNAPIEYGGFLSTTELQRVLGKARALLMTPRWVEAFGNVAIEALCCGVPVVAYRRGGPSEIVQDGKTGWLVAPDSVDGLVAAIAKLDYLDRAVCRQHAEAQYSLEAFGDRLEAWFATIQQNAYR